MAKTLRREWYNVPRSQDTVYRIRPIGDVHIGARACDEALLERAVRYIASTDDCYWIGIGDYCDAINVRDPRADLETLADWITVADLVDVVQAQKARFLDAVRPIASKCLGLAKGNHEYSIQKHYERDLYSELVTEIKAAGGFPADHGLAFGTYGWLQLAFYWTDKRGGSRLVTGNVHHGFAGGKLAGGKALSMERWLWTHDCDFVVFGHSHNADLFRAAVESVDRYGHVQVKTRKGGYAGTFLRTVNDDGPSTYSERAGYFPLPTGGIEIEIRPAEAPESVVRMVT